MSDCEKKGKSLKIEFIAQLISPILGLDKGFHGNCTQQLSDPPLPPHPPKDLPPPIHCIPSFCFISNQLGIGGKRHQCNKLLNPGLVDMCVWVGELVSGGFIRVYVLV